MSRTQQPSTSSKNLPQQRIPLTEPIAHVESTPKSTLAFSPAAQRNRSFIAQALRPFLEEQLTRSFPETSLQLLEIASGTGQHAAYLAKCYSYLKVQPTDCTLDAELSVRGWANEEGVSDQIFPLKHLDVTSSPSHWPLSSSRFIYCANMIHIAPWSATCGLFTGVGELLKQKKYLILYGPYRFDDQELAPSNIGFDEQLRARDSRWGIRSVSAIDQLAHQVKLSRISTLSMPANNHLLVYKKP